MIDYWDCVLREILDEAGMDYSEQQIKMLSMMVSDAADMEREVSGEFVRHRAPEVDPKIQAYNNRIEKLEEIISCLANRFRCTVDIDKNQVGFEASFPSGSHSYTRWEDL